MKIKKNYLLLILLNTLFFSSINAQIKTYKIKDGTKTEISRDDTIKIELDGEGKPLDNILISFDIKEFREKYNYDIINIAVGRSGFTGGLFKHEFDSELSKKKYADVKKFNFYAFNHTEYEEGQGKGTFALVSEKVYYRGYVKETPHFYKILGQYITGQEEYYDEDSRTVRTRNVLSSGEEVIQLNIRFEQNESAKFDARYKELIEEGNGIGKQRHKVGKCTNKLAKKMIEMPFPLSIFLLDRVKYEHLVETINEIVNYKYDEIKQEKNKEKAFELYEEWDKEKDAFCIEETESNEDQLKELEKKFKKIPESTTVPEKMEIIRNALK
ncbi:MAG: hypothetical protein ACQERC_01275 [Bacteroidota bacterium]